MMDIFNYQNGEVKKLKSLDDFKSGKLWVDITNMAVEERDLISQKFNIHPLSAEDLYNSGVRIKIEEFDNYLFCIFYALKKSSSLDLVEMDFILGKDFLITNHKKELKTFSDIKNDDVRLKRNFGRGLDLFLHRLIDLEVDNFAPALEKTNDHINKLEEQAAQKIDKNILSDILKTKRILSRVKRYSFQQREKLSVLAKSEFSFITKKAIPYFRDVYDHAVKVHDEVESQREIVSNAFDVYMSTVSNNMNEIMKTLSIIATIVLPLTVISGIYGTNFAVLPGSQNPYGFWIMIGSLVAMATAIVLYFKVKKWF
jgi:magnesium transporter